MSKSKKEQILDAAIECFTTYGYEKTSMSDIGKEVGLNKASLYYHYKDKLALFDAMVQTKRTVYRDRLRQKLSTQSIGIPQIITFLCSEIDFIEELSVNFLAPPSRNQGGKDDTSSVFQKIIDEDIRLLQSMIQAAMDQEIFSGIHPQELARHVLQTSRGLLLVDCPLDLPKSERSEGYNRVRRDIEEIITLLLSGAGG